MRLPSVRYLRVLRQAYRSSALTAQARVRLEFVDDRDKIIKPDNAFELETCPVVACPDHIGFDPAHNRQANNDPVAALQLFGVVDHKTVGGQIADVQVQIAVREMLDNRRKINRVPRRAPQVCYTKICSASHVLRFLP